MNETDPWILSNDKPIENESSDKLGMARPAKHIANAISTAPCNDGFVFGIEGEWGTGKSSFIQLIIDELNCMEKPHAIVHFSPWLINTRTGLIQELFNQLIEAACSVPMNGESVLPNGKLDDRGPRLSDLKRLQKALRKFARYLKQLGSAAEISSTTGWLGTKLPERAIRYLANHLESFGETTLEKEKALVVEELSNLIHPIVIFIDDIDRLDPSDVAEIFRLVKAVADFPNILYVLSYARPVVGKSLEQALKIDDGTRYLDKIVQVTFPLPKPEDFDLRQMFRNGLSQIFSSSPAWMNHAQIVDQENRLRSVIDFEGGKALSSPRDVIRTLNHLKLFSYPVVDEIDIADMVWLLLIRNGSIELYDWIENYLKSYSVVAMGATVDDFEQKQILENLLGILNKLNLNEEKTILRLAERLPGIELNYDFNENGSKWLLFRLDPAKNQKLALGKRLASPYHFRYYFSFSKPSGTLDDKELGDFIELVKTDHLEASNILINFCDQKRPQGGTVADTVLDRLKDLNSNTLDEKFHSGMLLTLSNSMDNAAKNYRTGGFRQI